MWVILFIGKENQPFVLIEPHKQPQFIHQIETVAALQGWRKQFHIGQANSSIMHGQLLNV